MRVVVSGSSGLIGSALVARLEADGHQVVKLVRRPARGGDEIEWNPATEQIDAEAMAGADAVVHLAGRGIGASRWTERHKREVLHSRVAGTRTLARAIADMNPRPRVMVSASAMGYYGDRGDELLTEASSSGRGFLAEVCREWEAATVAATNAGVRVVHLRSGLVLSPAEGSLGKMLPLFRLGVGGRLGSGRQWWSWVTIDDEVGIINHSITNREVRGAINAVTPNPVRNAEFTKVLGRVLRRPAVLPVPRFALAAAMSGEMTDDMLLASQRVEPAQANATGYEFHHPDLDPALRALLGRPTTA